MSKTLRRQFIKDVTMSTLGLPYILHSFKSCKLQGKRLGIIGLDTSHSIEFTKLLNHPDAGQQFKGFKVVVAYPHGSKEIQSSVQRIPGYTQEIQKYGVQIAESIHQLLDNVDAVLLETNDGRLHLEQALLVFEAGKPLFIDKPLAASLRDAITIYEHAKRLQVPVFSSSSVRFIPQAEEIRSGKFGKVLGADIFSPARLERTHPDLFWYGIHGVEMLYTLLGTGCRQVARVATKDTDYVIGVWEDERIGGFRGTRSGKFGDGGLVYTESANICLGSFDGYTPLLVQVARFFETGIAPVSPNETIELYAFMEAADESKRQRGATVNIHNLLKKMQSEKKIEKQNRIDISQYRIHSSGS